jgi:DNA-directed RNA polymerase subunit H (RpoH/RPB5)
MKKYSEEIIRHAAVTDEGKRCEILERITFERAQLPDGSLGEPMVVNRRYDLRTGECLNRISDTEFSDDATDARVLLQP